MYKTIKLSVFSFLAVSLFITGCSHQSIQVADVQPAPRISPAIDAQVQEVVTPQPPAKVYQKPPQRMVKPTQRQRMVKPVQRHRMMSSMNKPVQRQSTY